jgi:crotonobetainyl-CoA:carnitine CoA-transferase CaiB-like acyl-CoA transferase
LLDSAFAALVNVAENALVTGADPGRYGNAHPTIVPYQPFRAADGFVAVAAANDGLYRRLCDAVDRPELAADERDAPNEARVRNRESLVAELEAVFASRPTEDWVRLLLSSGVPAGKIRGVGEALRMAAETGAPATTGLLIRLPALSSSWRRRSRSTALRSALRRRHPCSGSTRRRCWTSLAWTPRACRRSSTTA